MLNARPLGGPNGLLAHHDSKPANSGQVSRTHQLCVRDYGSSIDPTVTQLQVLHGVHGNRHGLVTDGVEMQLETGIEKAYEYAAQTMACNMVHEVAQEGVQAFIEKRNPSWRA